MKINQIDSTAGKVCEADESCLYQIINKLRIDELHTCQTGLVRMLIDIDAPGGFSWDEVTEPLDLPSEVIDTVEWWLVTPWLAEKLVACEQIVIANEFGQWWGVRNCKPGAFCDDALRLVANYISKSKSHC